MDDLILTWSFPMAIALHNLEEAIWLPAWSRKYAGQWHRTVGDVEIRFAVTVLTGIIFAIASMTWLSGWGSIWHYLLAAAALGQSVNIIFPHLVGTIAVGKYSPGLLTGIIGVWPSSAFLLYKGFINGQLDAVKLIVVTLIFVPLMLAGIPLFFWIGRKIFIAQKSRSGSESEG